MVDALAVPLPNQFVPTRLFRTHIFSLPFHHRPVARRVRPFLHYFLFVLASVLEFSVLAQVIDLSCLLKLGRQLFKGGQRCVHGTVGAGSWLDLIPLQKAGLLVFVLLDPELVVRFIHPLLGRNIMRTVVSRSWIGITQIFSILIEVNLLSSTYLSLLQLLSFSILLFYGFLQTVSADPWNCSILLLDLDLIEVSVLNQLRVDFVFQCHFFELIKVPFILCSMNMSRGDGLADLELIVHIEASLSDVFCIFLALFLRLPLSLLELKIDIHFELGSVVLRERPGNVSVIIVLVHRGGIQSVVCIFRVVHPTNKIINLVFDKRDQYQMQILNAICLDRMALKARVQQTTKRLYSSILRSAIDSYQSVAKANDSLTSILIKAGAQAFQYKWNQYKYVLQL